jgi:Tol biopolymer transport system component
MMRIGILIGFTAVLMAAPAQSPDVQFRAAQQKETVEGDLNAAIAMYRKLADDRGTPADVAARALVRLGRCYQRIGDAEARKAFERVLSQFSAQTAAAAEAKRLLAAMGDEGRAERGFSVRKLQSGIGGLARSRCITRDGKYMAVLRAGNTLEVVNVVTGERAPVSTQQPIASGSQSLYVPAISPDGQRLAVEVVTGAESAEVKLIERTSGQVRTLLKSASASSLRILDWSRDGCTILVKAGLNGGLQLVDVASGAVRPVPGSGAEEGLARLSPDGQFIAYHVSPNQTPFGAFSPGKIFVERVDGSQDRLIADPEGGATLAGWSPDGHFVLYTADNLGAECLWAVRIEDGQPRGEPVSLANGIPRSLNLTIAETGSLIVTIEEGVKSYISSVDPASGSVTSSKEFNVRRNARILSAVWSPDGNQLVYNAVRGDFGLEKPMELYLHDERTGEERTLGTFPMIPQSVSWTRDAKALVMPVVSKAGTGVFRYWLDEGRMEELVPARDGEPVARALPKLSADGRTVYYLEGSPSLNGSKLVRYDLTSRTATTIATVNRAYDVASNGEMLAISSPDPSSRTETLRILSKDGQVLRDLVRLKPEERIVALTWSSDGKWIYFGLLSKGGADIRRISPAGGNSVPTGLRIGYLMHMAVHPSGAKITYFHRSAGELWRVDGISEALAKLP